MKYCSCGYFFEKGEIVDDGVLDSRFPMDCYNRAYIEVCPKCGRCEEFEELCDDDYIVADRRSHIAIICKDEQDIVLATSMLLKKGFDAKDVVVYYSDEIGDGDRFGKILSL